MRPVPIPDGLVEAFPGGERHTLGPPSGDMIDDAEVGNLEVVIHPVEIYGQATAAFTSIWVLDDEERAAIAAGGFLSLTIIGVAAHPVVSPAVWELAEDDGTVEGEIVDEEEE